MDYFTLGSVIVIPAYFMFALISSYDFYSNLAEITALEQSYEVLDNK